MESSEEILNGCVELFFTVRKEFKLRCRCCENVLYFNTMNDYIEHWINEHKRALTWFSQPSLSSRALSENNKDYSANQPTLVIQPSTRSFEINCNICTEGNVFKNIEDYVTHYLENHQNSVKQPYKDTAKKYETFNNQIENSVSNDLIEYVTIEEEVHEENITNLQHYQSQQGLQMPVNSIDNGPYVENASLGDFPGMNLLNLHNLEQTVQSTENISNTHAQDDSVVSVQDTILLEQFHSSINTSDVVKHDNTTQDTKKQLENVTVGLIFYYHKTLSSSSDVMHANVNQLETKASEAIAQPNDMNCYQEKVECEPDAALRNGDQSSVEEKLTYTNSILETKMLNESIKKIEKLANKERLIYISQVSNFFECIYINSTQKIGHIFAIGTLKNYSNKDQCIGVSSVLQKTLASKTEEIALCDTVQALEIMKLSEAESTNCSEKLQNKNSPKTGNKEYASSLNVLCAENELSNNTNSSVLKLAKISRTNVKSEASNSIELTYSTRNCSINENARPNTRNLSRKRKAPNGADQESIIQKKIAKKKTDMPYCIICKKPFQSKYSYNTHMKKFHPFTKCCLCKRDFSSEEEMLQHLKVHKNELECPICHEVILWFNKKHLKKHFNLLNCSSCDFLTCDDDILQIHQQICDLFVCKLCNITYKDATSYKRHAFRQHKNTEPFECVQCEQKFQYLRAMELHQKICQ